MIDCVWASSFHLIHGYCVEFRSADAYKLVIFLDAKHYSTYKRMFTCQDLWKVRQLTVVDVI